MRVLLSKASHALCSGACRSACRKSFQLSVYPGRSESSSETQSEYGVLIGLRFPHKKFNMLNFYFRVTLHAHKLKRSVQPKFQNPTTSHSCTIKLICYNSNWSTFFHVSTQTRLRLELCNCVRGNSHFIVSICDCF